MVNNIKIFSVSLVLFLIILSISLISALDTVSSGFEMTGGQTKMIVAHSVCKVVENQVARKVFVPTNTLGEWQSFMDNLPYGVVLHACPFCNDGSCNGAETCSSCPNDCGACQGDTCSLIGGCESGYCVHNICRPSSIYCGDIYCDSGETCSSCASDCGACCGNGACDYGETCSSCPTDCGVCYVSPTYTEGGDGVTPDPPAPPAGSYDYHEDFYSGGGDWGVDTSVNSDPDGGMPSGGYSGGPSSDTGGKVICTEANRLGYISDEIYNADKEHAEKYLYNDVAVEIGYHSWAKPFVRVMRNNPEFVKKGVPIAVEWSKHAAYEMGVINKDSETGKVLLETGIPMSKELGSMMIEDGNKDYEFEENLVEGLFYEYFPDILEMDGKQLEEGIKIFYRELKNEYLIDKDSYEEENFQVWF